MSKVIKVEGITILVRTRDEHPPPHVHVLDADNECQVEIGPEGVKLYREENSFSSSKFQKKALKLVAENLEACRQKWRDEVESVG